MRLTQNAIMKAHMQGYKEPEVGDIFHYQVGDYYTGDSGFIYIVEIKRSPTRKNHPLSRITYFHADTDQDAGDTRTQIGDFFVYEKLPKEMTYKEFKNLSLGFIKNIRGAATAKKTGIIEMKYVKKFDREEVVNEGIIDFIRNLFTKILASFKNPAELKTKVDALKQSVGTKYDNLTLDKVEIGKTIVLSMKSPDGKANDVIMLTKIAEGPKESILQLAGTTNEKFIKTIGFNSNEEIAKGGVLFMIDNAGLGKDKAISLRIYTPLKKDGTVTVTKNLLELAVPYEEMERANTPASTAPSTGAL